MTLHHVVVGVDGSLVSVRALDWAADESARRGAELRVVYAVPDSDESGPVLASAVTRLTARHPELSVVTRGAVGGPVRTLVRESEGADLTVVGTRGMGGIGRPAVRLGEPAAGRAGAQPVSRRPRRPSL